MVRKIKQSLFFFYLKKATNKTLEFVGIFLAPSCSRFPPQPSRCPVQPTSLVSTSSSELWTLAPSRRCQSLVSWTTVGAGPPGSPRQRKPQRYPPWDPVHRTRPACTPNPSGTAAAAAATIIRLCTSRLDLLMLSPSPPPPLPPLPGSESLGSPLSVALPPPLSTSEPVYHSSSGALPSLAASSLGSGTSSNPPCSSSVASSATSAPSSSSHFSTVGGSYETTISPHSRLAFSQAKEATGTVMVSTSVSIQDKSSAFAEAPEGRTCFLLKHHFYH